MASSSEKSAGAKGVAEKFKNLLVGLFSPAEEDDILSDDEVLERDADNGTPAVFMQSETPAVADFEEVESEPVADSFEREEERREEPFSAGPDFLYAHQNDYTGRRGYDDNSSVAFSIAGNTSFGRERRPSFELPAQPSTVVFGGSSSAAPSPRSTSTVAASTDDAVNATKSRPETDFSFSGAREPASFGSRPITRFDASQPEIHTAPELTGDTGTVKAKAVVGFNTSGASGTGASGGYSSSRNSSYGGSTMDKITVQIIKPTEISEATAAGTLLKKGIVVICNLSEIPDKNTRIRFSDFLCGCCKGCDADFTEIISVESPNAVLIAVPSSVGLKNVVETPPADDAPKAPKTDVPGPDLSDFLSFTPTEAPKASGGYFDISF